jgi:hypothetical protein
MMLGETLVTVEEPRTVKVDKSKPRIGVAQTGAALKNVQIAAGAAKAAKINLVIDFILFAPTINC